MTNSRGSKLAVGTAVVLGASALAVAYAAYEAHQFTLREVSVPVLPTGSAPVRVLHISDLHLVPGQEDKIRWVQSLAELDPDLVINTGDNFGHLEALEPLLDALGPLLGFPGIFVLGSNDYHAPILKSPLRYFLPDSRLPELDTGEHLKLPTEAFRDALRNAGWIDLNNRRDSVTVGSTTFELVGVDDPHIDLDRFPDGEPGPGQVRLGVAHAPYARVLEAMQNDGAELVFAGHTHGGQVCVPFFGALVTNCDLDRGRAKGLHGWPGTRPDGNGNGDSLWLHVSEGIGASPKVPLRVACRPSATLLTLVAREI